ncbi:MAG TPA: hypothetical protein RMH85_24645 [Polyangiaceae bacterium LLY-WYZ-15_(1-7)]|nr:hypothetical protein [Myxococcales bacterium]MAT24821.1 hypothetical protein [Sandaracinus sp.]HJK93541.1 hypothetical protein [Polyangiaceae bacterium LLY-WYZ-15_(1-7)]MBJ74175.1 hypothetical protein [Sandaracinus sp.]HJL02398.1 hypothetical protein [Polyangiaceae bacterium LLY-WYZ-15_(1-7)]
MTKSERELLDSPFLDSLRDLRFDETEYARLVAILESLSEELAPAQTVDKRVAGAPHHSTSAPERIYSSLW